MPKYRYRLLTPALLIAALLAAALPLAASRAADPRVQRGEYLVRIIGCGDCHTAGTFLGHPDLAPFVLVAMGQPPPRGWPQPATSLPRPPNDHLQYALTWFGLAGVLLIQFSYWTYKVLRP